MIFSNRFDVSFVFLKQAKTSTNTCFDIYPKKIQLRSFTSWRVVLAQRFPYGWNIANHFCLEKQ
jgi:hypothetical protein